MEIVLLVLLSIFPVFVLLYYFEKQDKGRKEPLRLKWRVFRWGIYATFFAGVLELNLDWFVVQLTGNKILYAFITAFVTAAVIEEGLKLWVVKKEIDKEAAFDEVMDGITYTILASLGFALLENILYVVEGGVTVGIIRSLLSVPAHALFSGIMGYYISKAHFAAMPWQRRRLLWTGFGFAVFYHGLFNFLLLTGTALMFLVIPLLITMGIHLKQKIKLARYADKVDKKLPEKLTAWRIIKVFLSSILVILGTGSFIGSIVLAQDSASGYDTQNIIYSGIFALVLYLISYLIIRKKT